MGFWDYYRKATWDPIVKKALAGERLDRWEKTRLSQGAGGHGRSAIFHAKTAIERNADHKWASTAAIFLDDAVDAAKAAAHYARARLDSEPLTPAQERMLTIIRQKTQAAPAGSWIDWTWIYNEWDPGNVPPGFAGNSAGAVWRILEARNLVETEGGGNVRAVLCHHTQVVDQATDASVECCRWFGHAGPHDYTDQGTPS